MNIAFHYGKNWFDVEENGHRLSLRCSRGTHRNGRYRSVYKELLQKPATFNSADKITSYLDRDESAHITLVYSGNAHCVIKSDIIRTWPDFYRQTGDILENIGDPGAGLAAGNRNRMNLTVIWITVSGVFPIR